MKINTDEARKEKFDKLVTKLTLEHGSVKRTGGSRFGWMDYADMAHLVKCGWKNTDGKVAVSDEWREFVGTGEFDSYHEGYQVNGLDCNCGLLTDRTVRYEGSTTEMLNALLDLIPTEVL